MDPTNRSKLALKAGKTVAIGVEGKDYVVLLREQIGDKDEYSQVWLYDYKEVGKRDDNATHSLTRWLKVIRNDPLFPALRAVGVIRDAEQDAVSTMRATKSALERAGCSAPDTPVTWTNTTPSTGFLIIPHDSPQGCLEHALLSALSSKSTPLLACAEQLLRCAEPVYISAHPDGELLNWRAKVQVRAILAACETPGLQTGDSSKAGYWDFNQPGLKAMLDFLREANDRSLAQTPA
jgi:hypothetical protein